MWAVNIVFLLSIQFCFTFDLPRKCVSDLRINNDRYNVTETYHLGDDVVPTDAHFDTYGNLFYVESIRNSEGYRFNVKVVKYKATTPQTVTGLPEGVSYSIAVDVKKSEVFFGTGKGMYAYDYNQLAAVPVTNSSMKLDTIVVDKNSNKYIIENVNGIEEFYFLEGTNKVRLQDLEALNEMAIDSKNNFYFIRQDKLYVLSLRSTQDHDQPTCIANVSYDGNAQITFYKNNVYVACKNLSYFNENNIKNVKTVDNVPGSVTAVAFDHEGHFIVGIQGKILKYKNNECYFRDNRVVDEYSTEFSNKNAF